jgi:UDP-3-O-[3-hydroxymyristoyl] glucosamine N-acyltransferase
MKLESAIKLSELARQIGCSFVGEPDIIISGINEIHRVEEGDVTFCDHPKYYKKALESAATVILIDNIVDCPAGKGLLICDKPFDVFTILSKTYRNLQPATLPIATSASVGIGTVIMPGVFIGENVRIGKNCFIHPNVTLYDGTVVGDEVIIHAGAVIGSDAFYYKRKQSYEKLNSCGFVQIDDNVEIGAGCTIDRGVTSVTRIGSGTKMDNMVHIGHDTVIGKNCLFAAQVGIAGVVTIEDEVILWGQVGIQKDLTIGKGAVVLGQSGVAKSLQGGVVYFGSPVREARTKMKELALIKQLPEILENLRHK